MDANWMAARWARGAGLLLAQVAACAPAHALEVGPPLELGIEGNGTVSVVQPLPDGRLVIGGSFKQVRGLRSDGIAMLEPDGTGVPSFAPRCRGPVSSDAPSACAISRIVSTNDGALIVAGTFAGFGPVNRERLAKLDAVTGAADPDWNPFAWIAPAPVSNIVAFGDRVVLVLGGANPRIVVVSLAGAGQPVAGALQIPIPGALATVAPPNHVYFVQGPLDQQRVHRIRLDTATVDPDWSSREFRFVEDLAWDPVSASLLVAGSEPFSGGLLGRLLARVSAADGAPEWAGWNPFQFTISRFRRLLVSNGVVFADACGVNVFPCTVRRIPLNGNGQVDPAYPGSLPFGFQSMLAVDDDGRVFLDRGFSNAPSPAPDGSRLVALASAGTVDASFRPRVRTDSGVSRLAESRSGDIVLFGGFQWVRDQAGDKFLRLRADTDQLADWRPFGPTCEASVCDSVTAIAADAARRVFIATKLFTDDGSPSGPALRRAQPEGEALEGWNAGRDIGTYVGDDARINALVTDDANGWLYIGGRFEGDVCGQPRRNLARVTLAAPCRADPTWQPDPDGSVESLLLDGEGRLVAGGAFRNIAGQAVAHLARFDGAVLDAGWRPFTPGPGEVAIPKLAATPSYVFAEVRQSLPGATPSVGLLRFAVGPGPDTTIWAPPPAQQIDVLLGAGGGRLFAVRRGVVPRPFATPVDRIEVFDAAGDGTPIATLPLAPGQRIHAAAPRADGGVLVGGRFDRIGSAERRTLATIYLDPFRIFDSSFE